MNGKRKKNQMGCSLKINIEQTAMTKVLIKKQKPVTIYTKASDL